MNFPAWQKEDSRNHVSLWSHPFECVYPYTYRHQRERRADTQLVLQAGGATGERLLRLTASAAGYSDYWDSGWQSGDLPIPAGSIKLFGQTLTPTTTNANIGELYISLPAGAEVEVPVAAPGVDAYSFNVQAEELKVKLLKNKTSIYARTAAPITCLSSNDSQLMITIEAQPEIIQAIDLEIEKVVMHNPFEIPSYTPANHGTLVKQNDTNWLYTAWTESATNLHPRTMKVFVKAKKNGIEAGVVTFPVQTVYMNIKKKEAWPCAYDFIRWKYATVLGRVFKFKKSE